MKATGKTKRGFATLSPERKKLIASLGGKAAHAKGTAHEFTADEARQAGRKGGLAVSRNKAHMAQIGRHGGIVRALRVRQAKMDKLLGHLGPSLLG